MLKAKQRITSILVSCCMLVLTAVLAVSTLVLPTSVTASAADTTITFTLGEDGSASHNDGSSATTYSETVDGYTLSITGGTKMYTGARDAKGNSCIKLGTSSAAGGFSFTVPGDVTSVVIYIGKYKANTSKVKIAETSYTLTNSSNDGAYDAITVDTSTTKTITLTTASGGYRAMVNTIEFVIAGSSEPDSSEPDSSDSSEPACEHVNTTTTTTDATCTEAGSIVVTCDDCDETISTEVIPATGHTYANGQCTICEAKEPVVQTLTLTFDNTSKRTSFSTGQQVWKENGIILTNNKASSNTNIADYANPVRFYANSEIIIECANMIKIEFTCNSASYATALKNSIGNTATVSDSVVVIEFSKADSYTISSLTAQVRMNSLTVYTNACEHSTTTTTTVDATCTEKGSITVTCDDCGETISTEIIEATGHSLDEGVITTQPQAGVEGVKTYTCQNGCGYTEMESIPALDATKYTLSFSVPAGVTAPESVELASGESVMLDAVDAPKGVTFVGWTETEYKDNKAAPATIYKAENEYTLSVEDNVTLYALYTYSVGSGDFVKVTEAPADWSGEYLIVYEENGGKAYIFNGVDAVNGYIESVVENNSIAATEETNAVKVIVTKENDTYYIQSSNGYIGQTSNANGIQINPETTYANAISFASANDITIQSGGAYLRFNAASNQMRFRYYKSSTYTDQKAIALYALDGATYYTTDCSAKIDNATVTLKEDIAVNYKVELSEVYADAVMYFTVNNETYDVEGKEVAGKYVFSLDLPPQHMATNISAELKLGDDVIASKADYSIQTYAQNMLNNGESSDELKQLLVDMLHYGAAAQNYKGYNTENLATAGLDGSVLASTAMPEEMNYTLTKNEEISSYPAYFKSVGVWFDSENKIYVKINTAENVTLKISGVEVAVTGTTIYTEGIKATGFADTYTFELYYDDGDGDKLMQTLTYSINIYTYKMQSSENEAMRNLALALYRYGVSAKAYQE